MLDVEEIFADFRGPSKYYIAQYEIFSSNKHDTYTVSISRDTGKYECSCPHFVYRLRKTGGKCKHILRVQEFEAETRNLRAEVA